jgi:hypothetical protein
MGFSKIVSLGPKGVSFDCTESANSVLTGIKAALDAHKLFASLPPNRKYDPTKTDPSFLRFQRGSVPEAIFLDWSSLIAFFRNRRRYNKAVPWYREHVLAAVESALTKNEAYLKHRRACLVRLQAQNSNKRRLPRPAEPYPRNIVLGCVAWDWKRHSLKPGLLAQEIGPRLASVEPRLANHEQRGCVSWKDFYDSFFRLLERVNLSGLDKENRTPFFCEKRKICRIEALS